MNHFLPLRRRLIAAGSLGSLALALVRPARAVAGNATASSGMPVREVPKFLDASPVSLPALPFAPDALEPVISAKTIDIHYGKHHKAYFDNLRKLITGTPLESASLEQIIIASSDVPEMEAVFNNAAQAWNHNFYWKSLSPAPTRPDAALQRAIERKFGSLDALAQALIATSMSQFGSGWGWLVLERGELAVVKTGNAQTPFTRGALPLLTVDVWEHAYYLDYQNRRADYLAATVGRYLNWEFASENFKRA
jgi:Fe-Mn family superoxide dismutase